jgi:hypothetical protein
LAGAVDGAVPRELLRTLLVKVTVKGLEEDMEQAALWYLACEESSPPKYESACAARE